MSFQINICYELSVKKRIILCQLIYIFSGEKFFQMNKINSIVKYPYKYNFILLSSSYYLTFKFKLNLSDDV